MFPVACHAAVVADGLVGAGVGDPCVGVGELPAGDPLGLVVARGSDGDGLTGAPVQLARRTVHRSQSAGCLSIRASTTAGTS
jgi:hypothetical protein